jgi:uncharacterized tellurite resistance protein B-like protein
MKSFKVVIGIILAIAGAGTLILYYVTDLINWNVFGWLSWLLIGIGGWFITSEDKKEEKEKLDNEEAQMTTKEKENLTLLRNLYAIGAADKKMRGEEQAFILVVMQQLGMNAKEIVKQMNRCLNHEYQIVVPSSREQIALHLTMMAKMMMIDGKASDSEIKRIKSIAEKWGVDPSGVDDFIKDIENDNDFQSLRTKLTEIAKEYDLKAIDA